MAGNARIMEQSSLQDSAEDGQVELNDRGVGNPHIGRASLQANEQKMAKSSPTSMKEARRKR
jgi:hypothetical protein